MFISFGRVTLKMLPSLSKAKQIPTFKVDEVKYLAFDATVTEELHD